MPALRKGFRDVVTLVIESTDVRYLSLRKGQVHKWNLLSIAPGLVTEGTITNAVEMGKVLEGIFQREALDRKTVYCAISGLRCIPRLLTLPKLQASLMQEAVSREARKEMPVSLDDLYLSWYSLPGGGDMQRVYMLGVPRETIDSHVRSFEAAGIRALQMDLKPLAVIRAVNAPEALIVNLEQDTLDIILVIDFMPAIMRSFAMEKERLSQQNQLERMVNELHETVRFYNESHYDNPVRAQTPVYLTGRQLGDLELQEYLGTVIGRPVGEIKSPFPAVEGIKMTDYATNIGLAMKKGN